ncbi:MAG: hypothetical protein ACJ73S_04595 [Mycobacteriales bacterium]
MYEDRREEPTPRRRKPADEVHEDVLKHARHNLTRDSRIIVRAGMESGGNADTGYRQAFPVTYDIVVHVPEGVETAEDE